MMHQSEAQRSFVPDRNADQSGGAVVDPEARVIGVEGIRIFDASVMPSITTGNLNPPTIMIGEEAAAMILCRPPLPASNADMRGADWQHRQR